MCFFFFMNQQYQMFSVLCMASHSIVTFLYRLENCAIQSSLSEGKASLSFLLSKSVCGLMTMMYFLCQKQRRFLHMNTARMKKKFKTTLTGTERCALKMSFRDSQTVLWHRSGFSQCFHSCFFNFPPFCHS